jgi:hypothetical protein
MATRTLMPPIGNPALGAIPHADGDRVGVLVYALIRVGLSSARSAAPSW